MNLIKNQIFLLLILKILTEICQNFDNDYKCNDNFNQYEYPESWDENCFQTPPRNDIFGNYKSTYQDMHYLVGYAQQKYSSDKKSCTITFIIKVNPKLGIEGQDYKILYKFGDIEQDNNYLIINSENSYPEGISISARIVNNKNIELVKLTLENEYFLWDNPIISKDIKYENGKKGVIVELFGWPYDDISEECEFLNHAGYLGIKIFPPNESILTYESVLNGDLNPWNYLYEPVSYKLESRMGNKIQLKNMINRCRKNGIRIYSEIVINHMCTNGNDMYQNHINIDCSSWGPKSGSAGSPFWTTRGLYKNNIYTGFKPVLEFPAVPYFSSDFHCYKDVFNCTFYYIYNYFWLSDLVDLNTEKEYVQQRIADFLTELISIGISGFSINAALFMLPSNYFEIFKKLKINLGNEELPEDFLTYFYFNFKNEGEKDTILCNDEINFGDYFKELLSNTFNENEINKFKISGLCSLDDISLDCRGEMKIEEQRYILNLVTQDIQAPYGGDILIEYKNLIQHKNENIKMLKDANKDYKIKVIFSSYSLANGSKGIPDGKSNCLKCKNEHCKQNCIKTVPYQKAYNPLSIGYDAGDETNWKEGVYTRIHRNIDIINAMREWMGLEYYNENDLYEKERLKADCNENCLICDEESKKINKCIYCNEPKGYYPIFYGNIYERYHVCIHNESNIERLYFDSEDNYFKPCYESCRTCNKEGNKINHNCLSCDINYIFRPDEINSKNCVLNCTNPYYFNTFGQYKCSETPECPKEANIFIKEKNKCINDCKKDNIYIYEYKGKCFKDCPENTYNDNFLCKDNYTISDSNIILSEYNNSNTFTLLNIFSDKDFDENTITNINPNTNTTEIAYINNITDIKDKMDITDINDVQNITIKDQCILTELELPDKNFSDINVIKSLLKNYLENDYSNNHIYLFKNIDNNLVIYKNQNCIEELDLPMPKIDFGTCYTKTQTYYSINDSLIIATMDKNNQNNNPLQLIHFLIQKLMKN